MLYKNQFAETMSPGFTDITSAAGLSEVRLHSGVFFLDMENDGDLDIFSGINGNCCNRLFRNNLDTGNWFSLKLVGTDSSRDGIGTRITLEAGGRVQYRQHTDFASSRTGNHSRRVHFGLGGATTVDELVIHWPSSCVQTLNNLPANSIMNPFTEIVESCVISDSDGDGVPDVDDNCPLEDSTGADANADGCIDNIDDFSTVIEGVNIDSKTEEKILKQADRVIMFFDEGKIEQGIRELGRTNKTIEKSLDKEEISLEEAYMLIDFDENIISWTENNLLFAPSDPTYKIVFTFAPPETLDEQIAYSLLNLNWYMRFIRIKEDIKASKVLAKLYINPFNPLNWVGLYDSFIEGLDRGSPYIPLEDIRTYQMSQPWFGETLVPAKKVCYQEDEVKELILITCPSQ